MTVKLVNAFPASNSGDSGMQGGDLLQKWGVQTPKVGGKCEVEGRGLGRGSAPLRWISGVVPENYPNCQFWAHFY